MFPGVIPRSARRGAPPRSSDPERDARPGGRINVSLKRRATSLHSAPGSKEAGLGNAGTSAGESGPGGWGTRPARGWTERVVALPG